MKHVIIAQLRNQELRVYDCINLDIYFGGCLAEYKYYDMYQVIESVLNFIKSTISSE